MRHSKTAIILALVGVVVAVAFGVSSYRFSRMAGEPRPAEAIVRADESSKPSSTMLEPSASAAASPAGDTERTSSASGLRVFTDVANEDAYRNKAKEEAAKEISGRYGLLLQDLALSPGQKAQMLSLLTDVQVAATTKMSIDARTKTATVVMRGRKIDEQERSQRIAAIIGDKKLQEFLALERNLPAYAEAHAIASVLQTNGVPLTDTQRDQLLQQLVLTREQYIAKPHPEIHSMEDVERREAERIEYERHVMELMPSVLSSKQVTYVFDQYQYWSEQRSRDLQAEKKRQQKVRAERPNEKPVILYPTE